MFTKEAIWDFLMITFGTVIVAASVFFFLVPSNVSVGSISGLAIVLSNFIPLSDLPSMTDYSGKYFQIPTSQLAAARMYTPSLYQILFQRI